MADYLPLVSREWKNGSNSSYHCIPFLHSLLTKGKTTVNSIKLETGLRPNSAGMPYTLLLRIEAMRFPTFGLLLKGSATPKPCIGCKTLWS